MHLPSRTQRSRVCGIGIGPTPIFFLSVVLILIFYFTMSDRDQIPVPAEPPQDFHFNYTVLKGYFMQSEEDTDDTKFDFKKSNFGLIPREYKTDGHVKEQWKRFEAHVKNLNEKSKEGESVKVLWLGRHGQGWHNVAEAKYGTKAWDCYYSALDGADGITWADANLTPTGHDQALAVHALWEQQLPHGIPPPESYYVSPLTRTVETADLSFSALDLPADKPYKPFVKELLREALGVHTCDRRSTKSHIESTFPHLTFEPGFSEQDRLWEADYREPASARHYRLAQLLDDVFSSDGNVFLSFTSHSGAIASVLEVVGHRRFALETGGVIPVVVKAVKVHGERVKPPREPSEGPPVCDEPPEV
ncbi:phosphoglycerate mutase-like protein [Ophiobolus disseminans]|uniref:Phosphoglycerate mutase-like protein n=1 Tax=Ophiobolus disseminans TaxID=1469910 RepID=A0A6A7AGE2_9PLEO|nr:phosphoglycerate mutase-like protein [Ophiobolus disseminans]